MPDACAACMLMPPFSYLDYYTDHSGVSSPSPESVLTSFPEADRQFQTRQDFLPNFPY